MKLTNFIIIILMSGLSACGSINSPERADVSSQAVAASPTKTIEVARNPSTATPQSQESAGVVPSSPVATPTLTPSPVSTLNEDIPLNWNTGPDSLIISATFCCSRVAEATLLNYIPDALIWGDGRIIWTQSGDNGQRQLLEGRLTPEQMQAVLQRIAGDGFFDWQERYADDSIADAPGQCLSVELESQTKAVCEYFDGAPQAFHDLYDYIATGAGVNGQNYIPRRGYLVAYPLELPQGFTPPVDAIWPAQAVGISLGMALSGVWLEDEALEAAWQLVNLNWQGAIIQDGDTFYNISVQIPSLSRTEPPAQ